MTFADTSPGDIVMLPDGMVVQVSDLKLARAAWYREVLEDGGRGELTTAKLVDEVAEVIVKSRY